MIPHLRTLLFSQQNVSQTDLVSEGAWRQINLFQDHEVLAPLSTWMGGEKALLTSFIRC